MQRFILTAAVFLFLSVDCFAQLPNTDIWLLDIQTEKDSIILTNPINITDRKGYDNQPSFSPDGKYILYTSMRDEKQTDIYKYDLKTKTTAQFTNTPTSEYSPMVTPDGKSISVVMVEPDSTQRLWKFPIKGGSPNLIMKDVDSVGYYCWIDEKNLMIISATEAPQVLSVVNIKTQKPKIVAINVGRCIQKIDSNTLLFVQKGSAENAAFNELNLKNKTIFKRKCYASTLSKAEDYAFKKGRIYMGTKEKLFTLAFNEEGWRELIDLSSYGIINIKRIAFSPDGKKMAIVGESKN